MVMRDPTHIVETILRFAQLYNSEIGLHNTKDTDSSTFVKQVLCRSLFEARTHVGNKRGAQSFKLIV